MSKDKKSGEDGVRGPSWAEVRKLTRETELRHRCRIRMEMRPASQMQRWSDPVCDVELIAHWFDGTKPRSTRVGHEFGGRRGARSLPAAWLMALYRLDDELAEQVEDAQQERRAAAGA